MEDVVAFELPQPVPSKATVSTVEISSLTFMDLPIEAFGFYRQYEQSGRIGPCDSSVWLDEALIALRYLVARA